MKLKEFFLSWGMLFIGTVMNIIGIYAVKAKMNNLGSMNIDSFQVMLNYIFMLIKSPFVIIGTILVIVSLLPYAIAVSRMELSVAYPVAVALNCLIMLPVAIIFLGESMTPSKIIGVLMLIISIYLLGR